jgi:transposase
MLADSTRICDTNPDTSGTERRPRNPGGCPPRA